MKNIIPALLSIIVGFALSSFTLNTFLGTSDKNDKPETSIKKSDVAQKTIPLETTEIETPKEEVLKEEVLKGKASNEETINKEIPKEETEIEKASNDETLNIETLTESVDVNLDNIQESFENWNAYTKQNIDLMSTFNPLDEKGAIMKKGIFLTSLRTGAYIPVKSEKKGKIQYQLSNIEDGASEKIKKSIKSKATIAHQYFKMEGKKLPSYDFIDLKGKSHNKKDTKGKIIVLKCWFITCKVCVEEFPQLNALVDKYKDDKIEFVSLAFDEKDELTEFLKTKTFKYATVPNQKKYMSKKLKVKQYPTHLIVDSRGIIIKMVNNVKTLTSELENILGK